MSFFCGHNLLFISETEVCRGQKRKKRSLSPGLEGGLGISFIQDLPPPTGTLCRALQAPDGLTGALPGCILKEGGWRCIISKDDRFCLTFS